MLKIRLAAPIQSDSILDGEGIRSIIWTQGCSHNCKGCHNPQTHSFKDGYEMDVEELKKEIKELKGQTGITLSGGDPLYQVDACLEIAKYCQNIGLNVWCYTGFTFEQLIEISKKNKNIISLLENIDVLVDGKFKIELQSYDALFRGSTNQRIIDVKESLKENKVVLVQKYLDKKNEVNFQRANNIYV